MIMLFHVCICLHTRSLVSASSPCFDAEIQHSLIRCVIAPPTSLQLKTQKAGITSVLGKRSLINDGKFSQIPCVCKHH